MAERKTETKKKNSSIHSKKSSKKLLLILITAVFAVALTVIISARIYSSSAASSAESTELNNSEGTFKASEETVDEQEYYSDRDVEMISKMIYGEAIATCSDTHTSYVVWCVLNRVDAEGYGCGGSIEDVLTCPGQFVGYDENNPVEPHTEWLVRDVLSRWVAEKKGKTNVGRTLPKDYLWFTGDGEYNTFRNAYDYDEAEYWVGAPVTPYHN